MDTVLVLTDFSKAANNAARFSAAVADQLNLDHILLYHSSALSFTTIPANITGYIPGVEDTDSEQKLMELKNELHALCPDNIHIEVLNDIRPVGEAIEYIILHEKIDLVIMGATEKGDLEESLFGGNTMAVVNRCAKPILVVPKGVKFQIIRNILLACDLKNVLKTVPVQIIKSFIKAFDAKLFILNVDYHEKHFRAETILEQTALHKAFDDENVDFHYIDNENTTDGILTFAENHNIQMLITIKKARNLMGELFHNSVSKKLIFKSNIPLLVFKESDFE